jgi:hypothetical protein
VDCADQAQFTDAEENAREQIQRRDRIPGSRRTFLPTGTMTTTLDGKVHKQPPRYPSSG